MNKTRQKGNRGEKIAWKENETSGEVTSVTTGRETRKGDKKREDQTRRRPSQAGKERSRKGTVELGGNS